MTGMFKKIGSAVKAGVNKVVDGVKAAGRSIKALVVGAVAVGAAVSAHAQSSGAADPTSITTSATTAFNAVTTLVVAVVGFYIIVKIVRGIKGR